MKPQTVIVYRSRQEQLQDEFLAEHPEYGLVLVGGLVLLFLIYVFSHRR